MVRILLFIAMLTPVASFASFGMLGRDQCDYQQTSLPTSSDDSAHASQMQLQELTRARGDLDAKMAYYNGETTKMQAVIGAYFGAPWCDAMYAHMDNGADCCSPTAVAQVGKSGDRMPAGNDDMVEPEVVQAATPPTPALPPYTPVTAPAASNSCAGYPAQYCNSGWGSGSNNQSTSGQLCMQTGFASTPAWSYACRDGGQIDPQVCSNPRISKYPSDYQKCISILELYRKAAEQKRSIAAQIQDLNNTISGLRNPSRPQQTNDNATYSGETTNNNPGNSFSGIASFLGNVIGTVGPFILNQYMSYNASKQQQQAGPLTQYGPRHTLTAPNGGRANFGPSFRQRTGTLGQGYVSQPQPPPPYYGPNYGYGLSNGGQYGQTLPGFQTGGFGCSTGMLGAGLNMIAMLFGGGGGGAFSGGLGGLLGNLLGGGLSLNAHLGGTLGANGGGAPYAAYQNGYGTDHPLVPRHTLGGYSPLYQPGGIYGGTPTYRPNYQTSTIPNLYTGQPSAAPNYNAIYQPTTCQVCSMASLNSPLGANYNAYYYAQEQENNARLADSQANLRSQQSQLENQLLQIRLMGRGGASMSSGTNYQTGNFNGLGGQLNINGSF